MRNRAVEMHGESVEPEGILLKGTSFLTLAIMALILFLSTDRKSVV